MVSFVLAAIGGLFVVQHFVPTMQRRQHNDVAGFIYAVLGVAYAVLLGLMVVAVWQSWEEAESIATEEANQLAAVFWLASGLPESEGRHLQEVARSYGREVVDVEWELMARGDESLRAWALLDEMRASILALEPSTRSQELIYDHQLQRVHELAEARRDRLLQANAGLPSILWAVLLIGGVIIVGFTYLFGMSSTLAHTLMVGALALIISLVLFIVGALDYPFRGDVRISPEAFYSVLERFDRSTLSGL